MIKYNQMDFRVNRKNRSSRYGWSGFCEAYHGRLCGAGEKE